jgi:hypothetical protein
MNVLAKHFGVEICPFRRLRYFPLETNAAVFCQAETDATSCEGPETKRGVKPSTVLMNKAPTLITASPHRGVLAVAI